MKKTKKQREYEGVFARETESERQNEKSQRDRGRKKLRLQTRGRKEQIRVKGVEE